MYKMHVFIILSYSGIKKKLEKLGRTSDCVLIKEWTRSIANHLYWSVSSSTDGGPDEIEEKWTKIFKKCAHKRLTNKNRRKKWFQRREL